MNACPLVIYLLAEIYTLHDRFVPDGVSGWQAGEYKDSHPVWKWSGSQEYSGHDSPLDLFHEWSILEQQSFLESAVGHIITVLSKCPRTVVQIHGNDVSVKNCPAKEKRTFTEGCLLENLFRAVLKMIDVEWLPLHRSKGGDYLYTKDAREQSDHAYELALLKSNKDRMEQRLSDMRSTMLPDDDPFVDSAQHGGRRPEAARLAEQIQECQQQISSKEGVISALDWM